MQGRFLLGGGLKFDLFLFGPQMLGLAHAVLEHQHRGGHAADLVAPVRAGNHCREIAFRQPLHRGLQTAERDGDIPVDQPCGEQCDGDNRAADQTEPEQGGVEGSIEIIDIGTCLRTPDPTARSGRHKRSSAAARSVQAWRNI